MTEKIEIEKVLWIPWMFLLPMALWLPPLLTILVLKEINFIWKIPAIVLLVSIIFLIISLALIPDWHKEKLESFVRWSFEKPFKFTALLLVIYGILNLTVIGSGVWDIFSLALLNALVIFVFFVWNEIRRGKIK